MNRFLLMERDLRQDRPLVTIGMPLFNEEKYLSQTLDALLAQDYQNFEVIISDNASSDRTQSICLEYAAKDPRIRYDRLEQQIDAYSNFSRLVALAQGEYFMWASGHDLYAPSFVSACAAELSRDPSVVLSYSQIIPITNDSKEHEVLPDGISTRRVLGPVLRYILVFLHTGGFEIYGLYRLSAMKQTRLFSSGTILGPDFVMLAELSLQGTFAMVYAPLYYPRCGRSSESLEEMLERYEKNCFVEKKSKFFWMPHWRLFYVYIRTLLTARTGYRQKLVLFPCLVFMFLSVYRRKLFEDLLRSLRKL